MDVKALNSLCKLAASAVETKGESVSSFVVVVVIVVVVPELTTTAPEPDADAGEMQGGGMTTGAIGVEAAPSGGGK